MFEKARQKMIEGINEVAGRSDCSEAVLLQQRSRTQTVPLMVGFLVVMITLEMTVDPSGIVSAGIAGLIIGLGVTMITSSFWLGRCGDEIVMVDVSKWQPRAQHVIAEYDYPLVATVKPGMITHKATLAGHTYLLTRQMRNQFHRVTGSQG